jgi:formylglycine-generating enzyme required for sulfatase activity
VINVSWDDAKRYVEWLSRISGKEYRLLTETEWEYAAGAGTTTQYWWGDGFKRDGKAMANCDGCGSEWDGKQTAPVGMFPANAFGLYDMNGNVWQWVEDCSQPATKERQQMDPRNGQKAAERGSCEAVPGPTFQTVSARSTATGTPPTIGPTLLASASLGHLRPERWISPPAARSIPPKILKPRRRHLDVAHRPDIVPEVGPAATRLSWPSVASLWPQACLNRGLDG